METGRQTLDRGNWKVDNRHWTVNSGQGHIKGLGQGRDMDKDVDTKIDTDTCMIKCNRVTLLLRN
jgi:hypothetical protein